MLFTSTLRCRVGACDFFRWRPRVLVCWVADFFRLAPIKGDPGRLVRLGGISEGAVGICSGDVAPLPR